jgi:hypothetical protein
MPKHYTSKKRKAIVGVGIFLAIACYIVDSNISRGFCPVWLSRIIYSFWPWDSVKFFRCEIVLTVAIYFYLYWTSRKIHSMLLNLVIAISGILYEICYLVDNYRLLFPELSNFNYWYDEGRRFASKYYFFLRILISAFTFVIILISLVYLKYNGDYTAPDEIQEYKPLKYCPQCRKPVGADENFCTNCGAKVE